MDNFDKVIQDIINDLEKEKAAAFEEYNRTTLPQWINYGKRINKSFESAEDKLKLAARDYLDDLSNSI